MYDTFGSLLHGYPVVANANQYGLTVINGHGNTICHTYPRWDSHSNRYASVYTDT